MAMMINFSHRGSQGDLVYSIPSIISSGGGNLYFNKEDQFKNLERLFKLQPNINPFHYKPEIHKIDVCLDYFRYIHKKDPSKLLTKCHLEVVNKEFDLTNPWLYNIGLKLVSAIVVNCTPRYHNNVVEFNWKALLPFKNDCIFIGNDKDYNYFNNLYKLDLKRIKTKDALEMAEIINGSKLFVGNQSLAFAIAEGLKHTRAIERFTEKDNCYFPCNNSYDKIDEELIKNLLS